jgi:hypothetical protein
LPDALVKIAEKSKASNRIQINTNSYLLNNSCRLDQTCFLYYR